MTTTEQSLARSGKQALDTRTERGLTVAMVSEMTGYEPAQIALVSRTVAKDAPLQELAVFLHACRTLQLDPLLRQAYWIRRKSNDEWKGALQVGIDGFRAIAERSGAYAGSEPPRFLGQLEVPYQGCTIIAPERAQVVVWKIVQGHKAAFTGEANWTEFYPGDKDGFMYRKMPRHMLAKDAEAQALRKAFPALLASVQISPMAEGELPGTIVEERNDAVKLARDAAAYDRIYGSDTDGSQFYDQPDRAAEPPPPAASVGRDEEQPPVSSSRRPAGEQRAEHLDGEPTQKELLGDYRKLLSEAKRKLGDSFNAADWTLRSDVTVEEIETKGVALGELMNPPQQPTEQEAF